MTSPAQRVFARSSRSLMNFDISCGGRLHVDSKLNRWDLLMSSVSMSRISSISTSIASVGGSNSFCSSSYNHISTASRFRIRLIWCDPYLAVRNFSRRSFTSPFSVKLTRRPVRPGDRSQSFMVSTPHCIPPPSIRGRRRRSRSGFYSYSSEDSGVPLPFSGLLDSSVRVCLSINVTIWSILVKPTQSASFPACWCKSNQCQMPMPVFHSLEQTPKRQKHKPRVSKTKTSQIERKPIPHCWAGARLFPAPKPYVGRGF